MTQKRKVGPGGGDFALNPNRFSGDGSGRSGASIVKRVSRPTRLKPKTEKKLNKELDSKNALLNTYINTYEDDGYEAY